MASTNKTTNYELSQFVETDRPAWLTDYNSDMRKIDSNLKEVSDIAGGASSSISELADRMSTAEGNISTNTNNIATLDARADALEAGQTSDDSRLDALEAEQIVQNTAIESNTRLGYNLARPYDSASTYAVGAYVLFQDTLYKCTTAVTTGEAFDPTKWVAIKATDEISSYGGTIIPYSYNHETRLSDAFVSQNHTDFTNLDITAFKQGNIVKISFTVLRVAQAIVANTFYTIGTLIPELRPSFRQIFPIFASTDNHWQTPLTQGLLYINTNGVIEFFVNDNRDVNSNILVDLTFFIQSS